MLTPYDSAGKVDAGVAEKLAAHLAGAGVSGVCPAGTTGEFPLLAEAEKALVNRAACRGAGGRVVAGVWAAGAEERSRLAGDAREAGAQAVFLTTPIFFKASPEAILSWYRGVRKAANLPLFAYSIPQYTGNPIPLEVLETLAEEGTIAGFKDSSGDLKWLEKAAKALKGKVPVFAGHEAIFAEARSAGAEGFISGVAGVFPKLVLAVWNGDKAAEKALAKVRDALTAAGNIPGLKYLAGKMGFQCGEPREPLRMASESAREALDKLLPEMGEYL